MSDTESPSSPRGGSSLSRTLSSSVMPPPIPFIRTNSLPMDQVTTALSDRFKSVVLFEVTTVQPDYTRPWTTERQSSHTGSGFAIEGRVIMTNAHVAGDALQIRIKKHGSSKRYAAQCIVISPDMDLALVQITEDEDEFWSDVVSVSFNEKLPVLQSVVSIIGYPMGGTSVCVTEGVVSRVESANYEITYKTASVGHLMRIQVDSPINGGNSGGPGFNDQGELVGVAFQGVGGDAQNVGYLIPTQICSIFLASYNRFQQELAATATATSSTSTEEMDMDCFISAAATTTAKKTPIIIFLHMTDVPFTWANLENKGYAKHVKLPHGQTGVVITDVSPEACANHFKFYKHQSIGADPQDIGTTFLQKGDVLTHIDGNTIGCDFTARLRGDELVRADFLMTGKATGTSTRFTVLRDGVGIDIHSTLMSLKARIPRNYTSQLKPEWIILGGFQFMPASMPLIEKIDEVDFGGPCPLAREDFLSSGYYRTDYNSEVIVLVDLLAADVNYGFKLNRRRFNVTILKSFNGIKVVNLYHLYYLWKKAEEDKEEFLVIETENDVKKYVLDTQAVLEAEASIVESHGLPGIASARLLSKMKSISHGGTSTPDEILALISPTLLLPTSEVTSAGTKRSIENRVGTEALKNKQRQKS